MALDKILIGERIRKIREETFEESRKEFAIRCDLTERYVGQIERGEFLLSLASLDKISTSTGIDTDFILYGKCENNKFKIKQYLKNILDRADNDELKAIYKCISTIKSYITKKGLYSFEE